MIRFIRDAVIARPSIPVVMIAIILLGALFLAASCSPPPSQSLKMRAEERVEHPKYDLWGNRYPELCRRATPTLPVVIVHEPMPDDERTGAMRLGAYWAPGVRGTRAVLGIDSSISDNVTQAHILLHERCHHIMWEYTGDAAWHN